MDHDKNVPGNISIYHSFGSKLNNTESRKMCVLGKQIMDWMDLQLGPESVKLPPVHTQVIRDFPIPKNVTDLRSFCALLT